MDLTLPFKKSASQLWIASLTGTQLVNPTEFSNGKYSIPPFLPPSLSQKYQHANNSQLLDLKKKEKLPDIDECSSVLETYRNSKIWIMGEEKFKNCCKIVAFGLDLWPSIGIDMGEFHRKQGINPSLTDIAVEQVGGYLNTFFNALYLTENDKLLTLLKELTAATSAAHRLNFAVSYGFFACIIPGFFVRKVSGFLEACQC